MMATIDLIEYLVCFIGCLIGVWFLYWGVISIRTPGRLVEGTLAYWIAQRDVRNILGQKRVDAPLTEKQKKVWGILMIIGGLGIVFACTLKLLQPLLE